MIFSGGFGFAGAGKIKPGTGETINLVWNGTGWSIEGSSTKLYWQDASDTEITSNIPSGDENDLIALCTLNGEVTLKLEADLTISTLFVFGGYPCTINLNGKQLEITDTLYLGSSYDDRTNGLDIDRGTIENDKTSDEDNRLGNLTLSGGDGSKLVVKNVNTSTWNWGNTKDSAGNTVNNNSLTINNPVALSVTTWDTGRIGDGGNGATKTEVAVNGGTVEIEEITGKTWELVDGLYSEFENVTGSVTIPTRPLGWIGTASTEWDVGENWASGNVPDENTETVYITKTNNQPVISSEVKLTGKIEIYDDAKLTIAEGGSLSIDANNITFGTGSSIVVDGTLNLKLTEDFTVGSNFAKESKGIISCTDSFNLIVDTDFEGPINFYCTKNVTLENNKTVSFGTIKANTFTNKGTTTVKSNLSVGTVTNNGTLTINEDSEIKNFSNNGSAIVNDSKTLKITKKFNNAGTFTGKLNLSGSELEQNIQLADGTNSVYETIEIDSSDKYINFIGNPKIKKLKVVSAKSVSFYYNPGCLISEIEDNDSAIDYNFVYLSFQDFDNVSSDDIIFNTKGTINLRGIKSSKNIIVNNGTLQINETFEGQDVISKNQTSINGTVNANDINCENTTITGNVTAKKITLAENTIDGTITGTEITLGKTKLKGNITGTDVEIGDVELNGSIIGNKITLAEILVLEDSELKIYETSTDGKITLNGNILSTDLKNLTLDGNVIASNQCSSINLNQGTLESKGTFTAQKDLEINAGSIFGKNVDADGNLTIEGDEIIINGVASAGKSEPFTEGSILLTGTTKINVNSLSATKDITVNGTTIKTAALIATENIFINKDFEVLEQTLNITGDVFANNFEAVAKTQTFGGEIFVAKDFTSEGTLFDFAKTVTVKNINLSGQKITFGDKVSVNQTAEIQNTGLLNISDFVYGKSFVQKGSESEIGQVMILGSFEQFEENGESENPTASFGSNVYFYNSSQKSLDITIGSDKSSTEIKGNLIIAKSKDDNIAIKGAVNSNNFALYSGNLELSGNLSTINDVVILGEKYSLKDEQTGIENLYSYNENRPEHWSKASYTFETSLPDGTEISQNYAGTVKVLPEKSITVGKNLYANGTVFALSGALGSGKWKLNVPDTSVAANAFCEVYNSEVSDCEATYKIAALQCTDNSGNQNWAFDDETGTVKITKAYSVSDNVIRVEFNKPVRILKDRFTQKQMRFSNGPDENHYFENVYLDEKCTEEASEVVNQYYEENGSKNYFVYVKANSKWNTDATGTFVGEEKSTDYDGVHQNTTICLDFPRAIVATSQSGENLLSYIITDLWGKRLTNYSVRTTSGNQKTPFENVEDKTGPVLISVKTGQENHTAYDGTKGAESQPSYDSHNFIEFVYSEFVNFGTEPAENATENPDGAEEVFLKADDQGIEKAKNIQVTQKFGVLQNEDITQSGQLKFAGLAKIQKGKIYTGSQKNQGKADKYVNALYRFDKYSLRYSIAGYTHPTEFVQDAQGNNHKKWIGYIQEAELPTGTVSMICDGKNDLVFDMAGNSQTLVKNNLTVDSTKSGVYGNWDISKPMFAPFRLNEKLPWQESECIEAIGNNYGFGVTLDRVEFHLLDNTPSFDNSDEAVWITERGWCKNDSSQTLILEEAYCADIFGGSRAFDSNKENRTAGGIRFSSLENGVKAFLYTTDRESSPFEKFDISKNVIVGTNARLFTGNATTFRDSKQIDGLYFSLPLVDENLEVKTTFKLSYDDKIGYITDLAGNRLKSKTALSVDRVSPSIETILSPIDNKTFYIIFSKKINQAEISLLDNDNNKIELSESFLELLPQCFELITINDDGTFENADIQIDPSVVAEQVTILENENYTAFKMAFTREVSLEDVKNVYLRVVNPKKYDYKMCDPITNIKDSYVTIIQDDLGNYIDMFQTHAISDVAINGINPLYGYNSSIQGEKKPISSTTQDDVSFVVRDWNENQQNYGTLYHNEDITIVCDADNTSKAENNFVGNVNLYFNNDTENKMTSEQFNKKIGGNLRIWFPNIMDNHFDFFTYKNNKNYGIISSEQVDKDDISAGIKFDFSKSVVENWKSGNQISYLFSYLNEDNSQVNIYPSPKFNLLTGLYELNNSMKFPLFAIRMKDVNDITSLDLWSFKVKSVTNQRGGVTILNNVINATYGEKAIVKINLPQDGNLDVMVMTLDGNIVTYLNHGATTSGEHYFTWNGTNNAGSKVARGLYFVRVISSTIDETRKIMVVKD